MQSLVGHQATTGGQAEFNVDLRRKHGHRAGMWTTLNVLHYYRARMLIKLAISRKKYTKKMSDELRHSAARLQYTQRFLFENSVLACGTGHIHHIPLCSVHTTNTSTLGWDAPRSRRGRPRILFCT